MNDSGDRMREHAWKYFDVHANQRMTVFNFFLVLSGLVSAGLATVLQGTNVPALVGVVLGLLLVIVSFVFWKLDQRASFLIKRAEDALARLEPSLPEPACHLFLGESQATRDDMAATNPWNRQWTYGRSFRVVFWAMALFGILGCALSLSRFTSSDTLAGSGSGAQSATRLAPTEKPAADPMRTPVPADRSTTPDR